MRQRSERDGISVHAIAGTEVVLLCLDATPQRAKELLGFKIQRMKTDGQGWRSLPSSREFRGTTGGASIIQAFQWGDYTVDPGRDYTYRITPVYGHPGALRDGSIVEVRVATENPEDRTHAVYFNRGVAGSRAYSKKFGTHRKWYKDDPLETDPAEMSFTQYIKPEDDPEGEAYKWLSRGLEEGMLEFIAQATGPEYSLRAAVYEFTYTPVIQAFVDALEKGADVKIVHHAKHQNVYRLKRNPKAVTAVTYTGRGSPAKKFKSKDVVKVISDDPVSEAAKRAVSSVGVSAEANLPAFEEMLIPRTATTISHNKFIILVRNGVPVQVWTGSTNFTAAGIFGQSNVGHVVRDEEVARRYLEYWEKLATDPKKKSTRSDPPTAGMRNWTVAAQPDLLIDDPPPDSITPVFSPRLTTGMLRWYAGRIAAARSSVFLTVAFSMADEIFKEVTRRKPPNPSCLRYLMLEGIGGLMRTKYPRIARVSQNVVAWGEMLKRRTTEDEHQQFIETLTGLNEHVSYLHTKYMLIDPLSEDPLVITGSANFSDASTTANDENMLVIRGNTRVADIFLSEFMRLFNHFRWRNKENGMTDEQAQEAAYLCPDSSWTERYYTKGPAQSERELFA